MIRVGLTGGLGAGKSTVARMFAARGAIVLASDGIGRELMQPGRPVYREIVAAFGSEVVKPDGSLDRPALAHLAFEAGRADQLNALVHPAVIGEQERRIATLPPDSIVVVESALIFETQHGSPDSWRKRFDKMVLVTAPEFLKIARFLARAGATAKTRATLEAEARRRLALQMPDETKVPLCDFVLRNEGDTVALEEQVERAWAALNARAG